MITRWQETNLKEALKMRHVHHGTRICSYHLGLRRNAEHTQCVFGEKKRRGEVVERYRLGLRRNAEKMEIRRLGGLRGNCNHEKHEMIRNGFLLTRGCQTLDNVDARQLDFETRDARGSDARQLDMRILFEVKRLKTFSCLIVCGSHDLVSCPASHVSCPQGVSTPKVACQRV